MKRAFTLIELLAVIVILGIIALITYPIVSDLINNSEKETFKTSVNELVNITEINYSDFERTGSVNYVLEDGKLSCDICGGEKIAYNGDIEDGKGSIVISNGKTVAVNIENIYYKASLNEKGKIIVTDKEE